MQSQEARVAGQLDSRTSLPDTNRRPKTSSVRGHFGVGRWRQPTCRYFPITHQPWCLVADHTVFHVAERFRGNYSTLAERLKQLRRV